MCYLAVRERLTKRFLKSLQLSRRYVSSFPFSTEFFICYCIGNWSFCTRCFGYCLNPKVRAVCFLFLLGGSKWYLVSVFRFLMQPAMSPGVHMDQFLLILLRQQGTSKF